MAANFPEFWRKRGAAAFALLPLAMVFSCLAALRRLAYRSGWMRIERLPVPVIVVGNVTVGGSGKTPVVLALARGLAAAGWQPGIISRGYGGAVGEPRPVGVDDPAAQVGDEPLLLARRSGCPVWVGRDRPAVARALLAANPGCRVLLSDDGLQHYRLARDIELVVLDPTGVGNGLPLPAGPLREPLGRIASAQALIVHGEPGVVLGLGSESRCRRFRMVLAAGEFWRLGAGHQRSSVRQLQGRRLHAVAGIGRPERFFRQLADLGLAFERRPFPDHHAFRAEDLVVPAGDAVLMTEKDAVKCEGLTQSECWVLRVEARIEPDLAAFVLESLNGSATA